MQVLGCQEEGLLKKFGGRGGGGGGPRIIQEEYMNDGMEIKSKNKRGG